jgi:hypothetical protein
MSVRVGITRLCHVTLTDALIVLGFAAKVITYFKNWWKTADPFKQYRVVQIPIEVLSVALIFGVATIGVILYSPLLGFMMAIPTMFLSEKGKSILLRRLREILVMSDQIIAFDCVPCRGRHGAIAHSHHPPRRCKTCKTLWKDEWADYRKRSLPVEMLIDDVNPGVTW